MIDIKGIINMVPSTVKTEFHKGARVFRKNAPKIFAGGALVTLGFAVWETAKGMHRADEKIAADIQRREESLPEYDNKELTFQDKASLTWMEFVPAAWWTAATAALIIASERSGQSRYMALMSAYGLTKQALDEQKEAEKAVLPEDSVKLINDKASEIRTKSIDIPKEGIFHVTNDGDETLYIEFYTKTAFYAKETDLLHAFNALNHKRAGGSFTVSISDLFEDLDLRTSPSSDAWEWIADRDTSLIEPMFEAEHLDGDPSLPATLVCYSIDPQFQW